MKTIHALVFLGLFSLGTQSQAATRPVSYHTYDIPEHGNLSITQQIARLVPFPEILGEQGGVVAISFKVNKNSRITQVKVYTESEALNRYIISHLKGKKLHRQGLEGKQQYRLRLHFAQSQILASSYQL